MKENGQEKYLMVTEHFTKSMEACYHVAFYKETLLDRAG